MPGGSWEAWTSSRAAQSSVRQLLMSSKSGSRAAQPGSLILSRVLGLSSGPASRLLPRQSPSLRRRLGHARSLSCPPRSKVWCDRIFPQAVGLVSHPDSSPCGAARGQPGTCAGPLSQASPKGTAARAFVTPLPPGEGRARPHALRGRPARVGRDAQ